MSNPLSLLALLVGMCGVALGGYALLRERPTSMDVDERVAAVEAQVQRLERSLEAQRARSEPAPMLTGLPVSAPTQPGTTQPGATPRGTGEGSEEAEATVADGVVDAARSEAIKDLVDAAVAKKAVQLQTMRNKKPSLDVFAKTLQLTDEQREGATRDILQGQRDIRELLEQPTDDGSIFLDEVVDVMASAMAQPGKTPAQWGKLFARLTSEKVPGTDETYAVRIEALKKGVRDSFKRSWTPEQYATFEAWQMDPTEVQGIEGSPWKDLEARILDRAKDLGAEIPDKDR